MTLEGTVSEASPSMKQHELTLDTPSERCKGLRAPDTLDTVWCLLAYHATAFQQELVGGQGGMEVAAGTERGRY